MKRLVAFTLLLLVSLPSAAVDVQEVKYVGGTAPKLQPGMVGSLDTTSSEALIFKSAGNKVDIPYSSIESFQYKAEVARHLGVLPTIVVALFKARQHRHFFVISYRDDTRSEGRSDDHSGDQVQPAQVVVLEVPKDIPRTLCAVLEARAPQRSPSCNFWGCWRHPATAERSTLCDTRKTVPGEQPAETH